MKARGQGPGARGQGSDQIGASLIELVIFIVIVGVAVAGVLTTFSTTVRSSADPMVRKQALLVAESLLEEVLLQDFTWCDPDDANAATATGTTDCATTPEALGPEAGETRGSNTQPYDNVNDYHGLAMSGIQDVSGAPVTGLEGYSAQVTVADAGAFNGLPAGATLRVTVDATGPAGFAASLIGYRTRHSPNP
jgi:MSHA pilin protein MshD